MIVQCTIVYHLYNHSIACSTSFDLDCNSLSDLVLTWPKKNTSLFSCSHLKNIKQARGVNFLWQLVKRNTLHFEPCPSGHYQRRCCWWPYPSTLLDTRPVFLTTPTNQHPYINDLYKIAHFSKMRKKRKESIGLLGWYKLFTSLVHFGRYCHKRCIENHDVFK